MPVRPPDLSTLRADAGASLVVFLVAVPLTLGSRWPPTHRSWPA